MRHPAYLQRNCTDNCHNHQQDKQANISESRSKLLAGASRQIHRQRFVFHAIAK
jgi:ribosomal protein L44E